MNFLGQICKALEIDQNSALELPRAATGIYLALKNFDENKKILMPANICYSPIRVSIEASYKPVFYNASRLSYDCNDIVRIANILNLLCQHLTQVGLEFLIFFYFRCHLTFPRLINIFLTINS
jgi:hypothetical protein